MNRDLLHRLSPVQSLAPAVRAAAATGAPVDLRGFDSAVVLAQSGAWTDGTHLVVVQSSSDGAAWTAVAAADLVGAFAPVAAAGDANAVQAVGYRGADRYLRANLAVTGATSGAALGVTVLRGHPGHGGAY